MSVTIISKPTPKNIKDKIICYNIKKCLEDYNENYIKRELVVEND